MDHVGRVQLQNALKSLSVNRTDEDAWRLLFEQTRTTGVDASKRVLRGQAELADDVIQEAFLRATSSNVYGDLGMDAKGRTQQRLVAFVTSRRTLQKQRRKPLASRGPGAHVCPHPFGKLT